jgi:hypothetical protein
MRTALQIAAAAVVCLVTVSPVTAQQDEKAMMEAYMKAGAVGPEHKWLEATTGTFEAKVTSWMAPGAPPMESTGMSESRSVLGGRWVEQKFTGKFMDQPFEGLGYVGYDNLKKQFVSTWQDNMSTAIMVMMGTRNGDTVTLTGKMDDPVTGKATDYKAAFKVVDKDHHTYEMWGPGPDGKQFKNMEIHYMRKK